MLSHAAGPASPRHEMKFLALDLKGVDTDGSFEGYASLFHREDLSHDVVMPGAFAQSLAQRGAAGIKMLFQHEDAVPARRHRRSGARGRCRGGAIRGHLRCNGGQVPRLP